MTYLSDTALSLEIHLVVGSLQESQLRKKLLKSVLQGLRRVGWGRMDKVDISGWFNGWVKKQGKMR